MPRVWKPLLAMAALCAAFAVVVLVSDRAVAQAADAGKTNTSSGPIDTTKVEGRVRVKHIQPLAFSAGFELHVPVHVLKKDVARINSLTSTGNGYNGGLRWYPIDGMAVGVRYSRGFLRWNGGQPDVRQANLDGFRTHYPQLTPALSGDEYLQLDNYTAWVSAYLGGKLFPRSKFNPYLTFSVSRYDWAFTKGGRGGEPLRITEEHPLKGKDFGVAGGIGTEYALTSRFALEAEWAWNYVFTALKVTKFPFDAWTNTHYWNLSFGAVWSF
jgi:hypothetical protein